MNNKTRIKIEKLLNEILNYWNNLCNKYEIHDVSFYIYSVNFYKDEIESEEIEYIRKTSGKDCVAVSLMKCMGYNTEDNNSGKTIIEQIPAEVYMSYQMLYEIIIDCELDYDKVLETIKFTLRHEIGHIISKRKRFIGKTIDEWNESINKYENDIKSLEKLRKNASKNKRLKYLINYFMNIDEEKLANDEVGITLEDIINNFYRTGEL